LPTLRRHVGELAQRPLESWTATWFVEEVAESHRRRVTATAKPAAPAIDDDELLDKLLDATGANYYTNASILGDLAPVRVMLASGLDLEQDVLATLRDKIDWRRSSGARGLESWAEPRFLGAVAETHLRRVLIPAMVATWLKTLRGEPAARVEAPAAVSAL
jgi:hypothetical protein